MKFARKKKADNIEINLLNFIDVLLILLIFMIITTTFQKESRVKIHLPQASNEAPPESAQKIEVIVGMEGNYLVNGRPLADQTLATLKQAVVMASGTKRDLAFIVTADAQARHQSVIRVMDVAGQLGFANISITTTNTPPDAADAAAVGTQLSNPNNQSNVPVNQ